MKIRPSILLSVVAVVVVLLALALWSSKRTKQAAPPPQVAATPDETSSQPAEPIAVAAPRPTPVAVENEGPIVFYGRLEDQSAEPVPGAEIVGTTVSHDGTTAKFSTSSDDDGNFKLDAGIGVSAELMPRKPGYALASTNNIEWYTQLKAEPPDSNKPVIIKMWKLQGAEPLATFNGNVQLNAADTPVYFDFVAQTFVPTNGDIKIIVKPPTDAILQVGQQDWSVEIEAADGGLREVTPGDWATTFWAPVDGYQPKLVLHPSADAQDVNALFFVQTRHGDVYTKLSLKVGFHPNPNDPLDLSLYGVANTNGSCNWEGDPGLPKQE